MILLALLSLLLARLLLKAIVLQLLEGVKPVTPCCSTQHSVAMYDTVAHTTANSHERTRISRTSYVHYHLQSALLRMPAKEQALCAVSSVYQRFTCCAELY
jgi:hypothetical protein